MSLLHAVNLEAMSLERILVKVSFRPEEDVISAKVSGRSSFTIRFSDRSIAPLELALISLGACAALDAYKLLSIRGGVVDQVDVDVLMERLDINDEKKISKVGLIFSVKACRVGKKEAEEAISHSIEKYCSVGAIFREGIKLDVKVRLRRLSSSTSSP